MHGLTDSPYSMRAVAEVLYRRGFEVTVLRLPGHGTLPSMMTEMHARDWTAAVELAARDVERARRLAAAQSSAPLREPVVGSDSPVPEPVPSTREILSGLIQRNVR